MQNGCLDGQELPDPEVIFAKTPFRILVVEDDRVHYTYCEYILQVIFGERLELDWSRDAASAIDKLNSREYEVCLLDYLVAGGDAKHILSRVNFGVCNTPFIVVSAFDDRNFVLDALRAGADDYVIKGQFTAPQLEQAIQYAIYRKYKELMLRRRALYDPLTGLANRHLLLDRLDEIHRYSTRHDEKYALMVVDVDKLKQVNDQHGHEAGDRYILAAANALVSSVRSSDTVARVGGDEFVAVLKSVRDKTSLIRTCEAVSEALLAATGDEQFKASASIGVSVFPDDAASVDMLLRLADQAMYAAKRTGGGGWRFV